MGVSENSVLTENIEQQCETYMEMNGQKYITSVDVSNGDDLAAACLGMVNAVKEFMVPFCRAVSEAFEAVKEISNFVDAAIFVYPNKRVVYLAKYGRSERVRKKNRKRILRWIEGRGKA